MADGDMRFRIREILAGAGMSNEDLVAILKAKLQVPNFHPELDALVHYVSHRGGCDFWKHDDCDCGLKNVLVSIEKKFHWTQPG